MQATVVIPPWCKRSEKRKAAERRGERVEFASGKQSFEHRANARTASTERTVARGHALVAARSKRLTASVPVRVLRPLCGMRACHRRTYGCQLQRLSVRQPPCAGQCIWLWCSVGTLFVTGTACWQSLLDLPAGCELGAAGNPPALHEVFADARWCTS